MDRPKIAIRWGWFEKIQTGIAMLSVVFSFAYVTWHYHELPAQIPHHFNASGQPDQVGKKAILWVLPSIQLFLTAGMLLLTRIPHYFNYSVTITPENAPVQYRQGIRLILSVSVLTGVLFTFLTYQVVRIGLGRQQSLWEPHTWILTGLVIVVPLVQAGYYYWRKKKYTSV